MSLSFYKYFLKISQVISNLKLTHPTPSGYCSPRHSRQPTTPSLVSCFTFFPDLPVVFIVVIPSFHPGGEIIQKRMSQENVLVKKYAIILGTSHAFILQIVYIYKFLKYLNNSRYWSVARKCLGKKLGMSLTFFIRSIYFYINSHTLSHHRYDSIQECGTCGNDFKYTHSLLDRYSFNPTCVMIIYHTTTFRMNSYSCSDVRPDSPPTPNDVLKIWHTTHQYPGY